MQNQSLLQMRENVNIYSCNHLLAGLQPKEMHALSSHVSSWEAILCYTYPICICIHSPTLPFFYMLGKKYKMKRNNNTSMFTHTSKHIYICTSSGTLMFRPTSDAPFKRFFFPFFPVTLLSSHCSDAPAISVTRLLKS